METRELRYFVAVAEELHFGRAASRLGIAQPPLSRAISQLERRLGVELFHRTSRAVELTAPGAVLLREGRAALDAVEAAERRTRRASETPGIVLASKAGAAGEILAKLLSAYASEPGSTAVDVVLCRVGEQEKLLRDGRADVALLHLPFDSTAGFDYEELGTESQVLLLPLGHALSTRSSIRMSDTADLPLPRWPSRMGDYPPGTGPEVHDHTQLLQLISLGRAVAVLPESCRSQLTDDIAVVPVLDAPLVTTVIAWPPHSRSRELAGLVLAATRL
ncbi:LysR family transcriptional regulator [Actinoplanes bogorensis]|uniref:LysR family transcriptional regulator n=1 Tax=Paractinoplanes bogorensis TaxID=1610840 RepID=A0ABS5YTZ2_9ACTN|nr:LysR family transcriptional regulator [Actinoplanes bogorensis]MBU2666925.1 LysR family transcriptional regulator [Actinoplanes bogorensis]